MHTVQTTALRWHESTEASVTIDNEQLQIQLISQRHLTINRLIISATDQLMSLRRSGRRQVHQLNPPQLIQSRRGLRQYLREANNAYTNIAVIDALFRQMRNQPFVNVTQRYLALDTRNREIEERFDFSMNNLKHALVRGYTDQQIEQMFGIGVKKQVDAQS
ncbi:hypothetical protein MIR68_000446 [Amoeboaphelidium protococcarum]|nr:hypothetical protein MIR68_000446 [Amoeboaphelidium protococcarum]